MAGEQHTHFDNWYYRSKECIAQGALTNSKRPESYILGYYPTHIKTASGATLVDSGGKKYLDYICSLGVNLFGHGNQRLVNAVGSAMMKGSLYSVGSTLEVQAAERLKGLVPFIDSIKFLKTGTEACLAACRIARAYTGKSLIMSEGYHGWSDDFVSLNPLSDGVCGSGHIEPLDWDRIDDAAAVIVEPVELDNSPKRVQFLNALRARCTDTVLIFDEVITGFRYKQTCSANYHGVTPDLICFGKAMGGGLPLSAVGGKKELMEGNYFVSSTFGGENLSLSAFLCACDMLQEQEWDINDLWASGARFLRRFNAIDNEIQIVGYPTRGAFRGSMQKVYKFWQECARSGILFGPSWFYNFHHKDSDDTTLNICGDVINNINAGRVRLLGPEPSSPFSSKQRS